MRESHRHASRRLNQIAQVMMVVLAFTVTPTGATQEPVRCPNPVYEARRFLQAVYPETKGKGYGVIFSVGGTFDAEWKNLPRLEITILETNSTPSVQLLLGRDGQKNEPLYPALTAYFDFDNDNYIEGVSIAGASLANDTKNNRIRQLVNGHQNWSDAQVIRALKQAGAKYGPDDKVSFLASLQQKDLEPFLGNLTVKSVEFHLSHDRLRGAFTELSWVVQVEARSTDGKIQGLTLGFEPFAGKLTSLRRTP